MKILVLGGCGAMGSEATRDLAMTSDFEEIHVADIDYHKASHFCDSIGDKRLVPMQVDVANGEGLRRLFADYAIVLNCTSYQFGLIITEAAIAAGTNLLDLGGLYNTPKQLALTEQAKEAGVTIVLGCGATPGITNLMALKGASQMDNVDSAHVAFATYRTIAPSPGLLDTVMDEFSPGTTRFYYEDGQFYEVPPFEGEKAITFAEPVGTVKTYYVPHSETHTLPKFLPGSPNRVDVRGTWRPETMDGLRVFNQMGLLQHENLPGKDYSAKKALRDIFLAQNIREDDGIWAFYLNVQVLGRKGPQAMHITYNLSHPMREAWGCSCTARVTGIPASIGAQLVAKGRVAGTGVLAPEACFDPDEFFAELSKRDIHVHETVVATQDLG